VSVIIPAYNHEHYVVQAIESVLRQSYRELEAIVVDDGSTDTTWQALKDYATSVRDPRLKIFSKDNEGVAATLNYGIARSSGTFVSLLASDDYFHPEKIERQVELFKASSSNVAVVHSGAYADYGEAHIVDMHAEFKPAEGRCFAELLGLEKTAIASSIMVRRSVVQEIGGFDTNLPTEDIAFFAAVGRLGYEFRHDRARLVYKRFQPGSLGGRVDICFDSHFLTLQKYRSDLSPEKFREIEEKLYWRMCLAASMEGMRGLAWTAYRSLA
jgi:glycosyltransferase involved in cell wall biosynthesis